MNKNKLNSNETILFCFDFANDFIALNDYEIIEKKFLKQKNSNNNKKKFKRKSLNSIALNMKYPFSY